MNPAEEAGGIIAAWLVLLIGADQLLRRLFDGDGTDFQAIFGGISGPTPRVHPDETARGPAGGPPPTTTLPPAPTGGVFSHPRRRAYGMALARLVVGILACLATWPLVVALSWNQVTVTWPGQSPWDSLLMGWGANELLAIFGILFMEITGVATAARGFLELRALRGGDAWTQPRSRSVS